MSSVTCGCAENRQDATMNGSVAAAQCWQSFTHTHRQGGLVLLVGLFLLLLLLLPAPPPHDGLRLVLFAAQVVSVGQAGTPHHLPVGRLGEKIGK